LGYFSPLFQSDFSASIGIQSLDLTLSSMPLIDLL
jgi:hypothetical protein